MEEYKNLTDNEVNVLPNESSYIARNACQWDKADDEAVSVQALGHSMNAVRLPKGKTLTYTFDSEKEGDALLRIALIPTQPNDKGDLRFSVSIDGGEPKVFNLKEPFRSERWKQNVLRQQAVRELPANRPRPVDARLRHEAQVLCISNKAELQLNKLRMNSKEAGI